MSELALGLGGNAGTTGEWTTTLGWGIAGADVEESSSELGLRGLLFGDLSSLRPDFLTRGLS